MNEGRLLRPAPAREPEPTQAAGLEELVKESIGEIEAKDPVVEFGEKAIEDYKHQVHALTDPPQIIQEEKPYESFGGPEDDMIEDVPESGELPEPMPIDKAEPFINEPIYADEEVVKEAIEEFVPEEVPIVEQEPIIVDNPDTPLIETSWTKPSPAYQNGKLIIKSRSDGKQHVFEGATEEEAKAKAYAALKLFYDVSNLSL